MHLFYHRTPYPSTQLRNAPAFLGSSYNKEKGYSRFIEIIHGGFRQLKGIIKSILFQQKQLK
jgi:hypothetical protein